MKGSGLGEHRVVNVTVHWNLMGVLRYTDAWVLSPETVVT